MNVDILIKNVPEEQAVAIQKQIKTIFRLVTKTDIEVDIVYKVD